MTTNLPDALEDTATRCTDDIDKANCLAAADHLRHMPPWSGSLARQLSKDDLVAILEDIVVGLKTDDSMEGTITYEWNEHGTFDVTGVYRIGNSDGQGGVVLISQLSV